MIVSISDWIKTKAIRYRNIVDRSPNYKMWDQPKEVCASLSKVSVDKIQLEVALLDMAEAWGEQERLNFEKDRQARAEVSTSPLAEIIILK